MSDESHFWILNNTLFNEFKTRVDFISNSLEMTRSATTIDRIAVIRHYEELAIVLQSTVSQLIANSDPKVYPMKLGEHPLKMRLYEDNKIYNLLARGWGFEYYSTDEIPDYFDERLFNSLIQVVDSTLLVMDYGYDLNKRAISAVQSHVAHPQGKKVATRVSSHYEIIMKVINWNPRRNETV